MGSGGGCGDFCCIGDCGFCCVFNCCIGDFFGDSDSGGGGRNSGGRSSGGSGRSSGGGCGAHTQVNSTSSARVTVDAAAELEKLRKRADERAQKEEADILKDMNETMEELLKWVRKENEKKFNGVSLDINIERLEKINDELHDEVVGFIGRKLGDRLVLTDKELSVILQEPDDTNRKKNFDAFCNRLVKAALKDLINKIEASVKKQSDSIVSEIQIRLNEVNRSLDREVKEFEELQAALKSEGDALARKQIEYMYRDALCDVMLEELSSDERKGA